MVADEIKNLAETTRSTAADIVGLIDKIQQESHHAIEAMSRGMENVAQGIKLGRQADEAFAKIQESTSSVVTWFKRLHRLHRIRRVKRRS